MMNRIPYFEAIGTWSKNDRTLPTAMLLTRMLPLLLCLLGTAQAEDALRIGVAERDITPPASFPMAGYYHERLAEGTIDPLKAKAMVFAQGDTVAAMVVCDLTAISRDLCESVRLRASKSTGIPPQWIAISGTHSHTAPDYSKHLYQYLKDHKQGDQSNASHASSPYSEKLLYEIVQSIVEAKMNLEPVTLAAGSAMQSIPVSFNRRFVMKDGSVQTWKNMADPSVVRAAGPIDPEVSVVAVRSQSGALRGVLSNFALHLDTVGGMRWSADYPYFIEQSIRNTWGKDVISIFGTGCCGDINHSNPQSTLRNKTDFIGKAIASTIDTAMPNVRTLESSTLQSRSTTVHLPLQSITQDEVDRATQILKVIQGGGKIDFLDQVHAYKTVMLGQFRSSTHRSNSEEFLSWGLSHAWAKVGDRLPVDVQTITVGDELAIVFLPGEVFVELGLAIKQGSPFRTTLVIELSNCVETAYIPTRAACAGGSYEVTNSTVEPGSGEMLVEAALGLLRQSAASLRAAH